VVRKPEEIDDPLERLKRAAGKRAPLAKDELLDVVVSATEERQREERVQRAAAPLAEDKLGDFRNQGPLNYPPAYPDS
jgi:hypothetical protein